MPACHQVISRGTPGTALPQVTSKLTASHFESLLPAVFAVLLVRMLTVRLRRQACLSGRLAWPQAGGLAGRRAGLQAGRALFCSISSVGTSMSSLDSRLSFCPSAPRRHRRVTALPPFAWSFLSLVARGAPPAPLLAPPFRHVRRGEARKRLGPARRWRGGRAFLWKSRTAGVRGPTSLWEPFVTLELVDAHQELCLRQRTSAIDA